MYAIDVDTQRRVIWITTWGLWSGKTIAAFSVELLTRATAAIIRHGQMAVFADGRAAPIQTGEVADGTAKLMTKGLKLTSAPIVGVAGSTLGKIQAERIMAVPNCRIFTDVVAAQAFLEEQWPSAKGGKCPPIKTVSQPA